MSESETVVNKEMVEMTQELSYFLRCPHERKKQLDKDKLSVDTS